MDNICKCRSSAGRSDIASASAYNNAGADMDMCKVVLRQKQKAKETNKTTREKCDCAQRTAAKARSRLGGIHASVFFRD